MEEKKREELSLPSYMQRKSNRKPLTPSYVQSQSQARKPGAGQRPQAIKRAPQKSNQPGPAKGGKRPLKGQPPPPSKQTQQGQGYHPPPQGQIHTQTHTAPKDGPRKS